MGGFACWFMRDRKRRRGRGGAVCGEGRRGAVIVILAVSPRLIVSFPISVVVVVVVVIAGVVVMVVAQGADEGRVRVMVICNGGHISPSTYQHHHHQHHHHQQKQQQ